MITLWTDGSASPNPGPGGFAVISDVTHAPVVLGRERESSNIRMEGAAIRAAILYAGDEPVEIHSDSEFWKNVLTLWAPNWKRNGWKKKGGPIKNLELVKDLYEIYTMHDVTLVWVKGHAGIELNELCDEWANNARKGIGTDEVPVLEVDTSNKNKQSGFDF